MGRWWTTFAAVTVLVGAGLASARDTPAEALTSDHRTYQFALSAESITGLSPGTTKSLRITARNPTGDRILITQIRAEVVASSRRHCRGTSANLTISRFAGSLPQPLEAHRTRIIGSLPVSMPVRASGTCPDTTFTLKITGTARR